jgi:hypothetical protein
MLCIGIFVFEIWAYNNTTPTLSVRPSEFEDNSMVSTLCSAALHKSALLTIRIHHLVNQMLVSLIIFTVRIRIVTSAVFAYHDTWLICCYRENNAGRRNHCATNCVCKPPFARSLERKISPRPYISMPSREQLPTPTHS